MGRTFRWNVGLLFVLGVLFTIGVNLWRIVQPYTQPPPRPEFETKKAKKPIPPKPPVVSQPTPTTTTATEPPPVPEPPPIGAGKVIPDVGLILRDEPTSESGGAAGIPFNAQISIIEESSDGEWIKVRNDDTGDSGWVRSNNIER